MKLEQIKNKLNIKEELDPKRLKFEIEQLLAHISDSDKQKMSLEDENKKLKLERDRMIAAQNKNRINTNYQLRNTGPNTTRKPTTQKPTVSRRPY